MAKVMFLGGRGVDALEDFDLSGKPCIVLVPDSLEELRDTPLYANVDIVKRATPNGDEER